MASVNGSSQSCDGQMNCLMCFGEFKDPRTLPCFHSFCEKCLTDYITANVKNASEKIECPLCSKKCDPLNRALPIEKWATSFAVDDMIEAVMKVEQETKELSKLCDLCKSDGQEVDAEYWCSNCRDKICSSCARHHSRSTASKHHKTVPVDQIKAGANVQLSFSQYCCCVRGNPVEIFCLDHKQICCTVCATTVHRQCKRVEDLDSKGNKFIQENMTMKVLQDIGKLMKNIQKLDDEQRTMESIFQFDIDKCLKDMDDICNDIKQEIEAFQMKFLKAANEIRGNVKSKLNINQEKLHLLSTNVYNSSTILNVFSQHGTPKQTFLACDTVTAQLTSHYAKVKKDRDDEVVRVCLDVNKKIKEFKTVAGSLAEITTSSVSSITASNFKENMSGIFKIMATRTRANHVACAAQIAKVNPLNFGISYVKSVKKHDVPGVTNPHFSGGTSLSNGHLIMSDMNNSRLVEFNTSHKMIKEYKLEDSPTYVTSDDDDIYVSVRRGIIEWEYYIYKCRLDRGLSILSKTEAPYDIYGFAVSRDGMFIIDTGHAVHVLSESGKRVHKITKSRSRCGVAVSRSQPIKFYHKDNNDIVCRSLQNGKQQFRYRKDEMDCPRGICTGDQEEIYVCCPGSRNVHQISADGKCGRVILNTLHGIIKPRSVLYNKFTKEIVVTPLLEEDSDTLLEVYKLT